MPPVLLNLIVFALLALAVGLAVRSLWKGHKSGRHTCGGDCSCCADKVQIGPASACRCSETVCATFKERTE